MKKILKITLFLFTTICMCGLCNVERFVRKNRRMSSKSSRVLLHSCKYLRKIQIYIFSFQRKQVKQQGRLSSLALIVSTHTRRRKSLTSEQYVALMKQILCNQRNYRGVLNNIMALTTVDLIYGQIIEKNYCASFFEIS